MTPNKEILDQYFKVEDGVLYWNNGKRAGTLNSNGYWRTQLGNRLYYNHRIIYCMSFGTTPEIIDHVDGDKQNNRIENLRAATSSQNLQNSKKRVDNASGAKGVSWDNSRNKWVVRIKVGTAYRHLGRFEDIELAELVATEAREKYHTNFVRHE